MMKLFSKNLPMIMTLFVAVMFMAFAGSSQPMSQGDSPPDYMAYMPGPRVDDMACPISMIGDEEPLLVLVGDFTGSGKALFRRMPTQDVDKQSTVFSESDNISPISRRMPTQDVDKQSTVFSESDNISPISRRTQVLNYDAYQPLKRMNPQLFRGRQLA